MKIKTDFVTNSSSSSFVLWGVCLSLEDLPEDLKNSIFESYKKDAVIRGFKPEECYETPEEYMSDDPREFIYELENMMKNLDLKIEIERSHYEDGEFYIGIPPAKMDMDQTLRQLFDQIKKELAKLSPGFEDQQIDYHHECFFG